MLMVSIPDSIGTIVYQSKSQREIYRNTKHPNAKGVCYYDVNTHIDTGMDAYYSWDTTIYGEDVGVDDGVYMERHASIIHRLLCTDEHNSDDEDSYLEFAQVMPLFSKWDIREGVNAYYKAKKKA